MLQCRYLEIILDTVSSFIAPISQLGTHIYTHIHTYYIHTHSLPSIARPPDLTSHYAIARFDLSTRNECTGKVYKRYTKES